jgi:hypothetical protein
VAKVAPAVKSGTPPIPSVLRGEAVRDSLRGFENSLSPVKSSVRGRTNSLPSRHREFASNHCDSSIKLGVNRLIAVDSQKIHAKIACRQGIKRLT